MAGQSYFAYQGDNRQFSQQTTLPLRALNAVNPIDDDGCQPLADNFGHFAGSMVMVDYRHIFNTMAIPRPYMDHCAGKLTVEPGSVSTQTIANITTRSL